MKVTEAITIANQLRLNTLGDELKAAWLNQLDCEIAEMMAVDPPQNKFPDEQELLMPREHEQLYPQFLVAKIDYYNGEFDLYNNDIILFNDSYAKAKAWYRRNNRPKSLGKWRV